MVELSHRSRSSATTPKRHEAALGDVRGRGATRRIGVLDALHKVKWYHDGTLTFRRSCAHGVCGSDAMVINGPTCWPAGQLIEDVGTDITVEPIRGLPVIKDLVVDMEPFFAQYRSVLPYLINTDDPGYKERHQSAGGPGAVRRHHQVHPVRRLHHVVPGLLGQLDLRRPGRHRQRPPLHLRQPRPGRRRSASTSSTSGRACGAAARPSTAPRPAPAASRSPRPSKR